MQPLVKKNINVLVPLMASVLFVYKTDVNLSNPKKSLPVALLIFIIVWFITNQITSFITAEQSKPKDGNIPTSENYDASTFCGRLYEDISCLICWRDRGLYKELAALPDSYLIAVNKYWNDNYFTKIKQSLRVAINDETLGWTLEATKKTLNERFDNLNIQ